MNFSFQIIFRQKSEIVFSLTGLLLYYHFVMDIDDEDDGDSQRPPFDPAALERELNEKYKANLFHAIPILRVIQVSKSTPQSF